jgi:hypothetical protein
VKIKEIYSHAKAQRLKGISKEARKAGKDRD